jgi:hypothetical protein
MPIKQVTCSVCGSVVNKAITYSLGKDQRACKVHEGVLDKKDALQREQQSKLQRAKSPPPRLFERYNKAPAPPPSSMKPKCWVCMNEGLGQQEFFFKVLVEIQKNEKIRGGPVNPFSKEGQISLRERCIFVLDKLKCEPALKYLREDLRILADMSGVVSICGPCCGTFKVQALPEVSQEQLITGVAVAGILKPALSEIAGRELARDN